MRHVGYDQTNIKTYIDRQINRQIDRQKVFGVPEGKGRKGQRIFEGIMIENFPSCLNKT